MSGQLFIERYCTITLLILLIVLMSYSVYFISVLLNLFLFYIFIDYFCIIRNLLRVV